MKEFVYLYPSPAHIDFICPPHHPNRQKYSDILNQAIDARYRQQGFNINYVIFEGQEISPVIQIQPGDGILKADITYETHTTKQPNGEYPYPNPDFILDQLAGLRILRVSGFHLGDCVDRLAQRAYQRGIDVLVDEDLTEVLPGRLDDSDFRVDIYPTYNPHKYGEDLFRFFMEGRRDKPWLWQNF